MRADGAIGGVGFFDGKVIVVRGNAWDEA